MTACSRCATLPEPLLSEGTLFLAPPLAHTQSTLRKSFRDRGIAFEEPAPLIVSVPLSKGRLDEVVAALTDNLSEAERRDTRALIMEAGQLPTLADLMSTRTAASLMATVSERWLIEMLRDDRLTTHFQPIVRMENPSKVYAYECLLRGTLDGGVLASPGRMYDAARDADLLFQLDRAARLTSIREAITHGIVEQLFINFNPSSVYDPNYCLRSTIAAIDEAGIDPARIVFEVVESDQVDVDLLGIMKAYRNAGFRVALDDLGAGYGSLNLLGSLRPDIVKLDMKMVRDVDSDPYKASICSTLLEMARKLGIETVAEGIETPGEFAWFRDQGADLAQGYLIARPASPPPMPANGLANLGCSTRLAS
jgi:EAL domain-containing protein (putative c-di-GMP-specific phosphodiesterase class I)